MAWDPSIEHPLHPEPAQNTTAINVSDPATAAQFGLKPSDPPALEEGADTLASAESLGIVGYETIGSLAGDDNEFERLKTRLHEMNLRDQELRELEDEIDQQDRVIADLKIQLKDAKDTREELIANMRHAVRRRNAATKQKALPFDASNGQPANDGSMSAKDIAAHVIESIVDEAAAMPIAELHAPEGYTEKMIEAGITTVGELEKRIGAGEFLPSAIKGLGQAAIDKITDCLVNFRNDHPVPVAKPAELDPEDDPAVVSVWVGKCRQLANNAVGLIAKMGDEATQYAKELTAMGNMIDKAKRVPETMVKRIGELGELIEKALAA
jgi:hypothetical protein